MAANVPPPHVRQKSATAHAGFSLVEVCLALGIVAFALLPLIGLLTVGLDSYHNANLRGRAAQVVSKIASAIRAGAVTSTGSYAAAAPFDPNGKAPITWSLTTTPATTASQYPPIYFDENGEITTATSSGIGWNPPQMVAMVILTPPTTQFDAGKAQIAVAWPAFIPPTYTASKGIVFTNPQGHDESTISFVTSTP